MGLGKTAATLFALDYLMREDLEVLNCLVIAPKRVVETVWAEEATAWGIDLSFSKIIGTAAQRTAAAYRKADIYLVSKDNVAWLRRTIGLSKFEMVVIDESTAFKNPNAKKFKALRTSTFNRTVLLTGTPAPNGLEDLWSQFFLLDGGERLEKTITRYRHRYFTPGLTNGHIVYNYRIKPGAEKVILGKIDDITLKMTTDDYLDLPDIIHNKVEIDFPSDLKSKFKEFKKELILDVEGGGTVTALTAAALANKLLQFTSGNIYDEEKEVHNLHDLKLDALSEIVESGENLLVAWAYKHERDAIMKKFPFARELHDGKDIADWNAEKIRMLLTHPASAGHGLNLQGGGHVVVWTTPSWNFELVQQFNARLHRQGQKRPVIVHNLVMKGTLDNRVIDAISSKKTIQNLIQNFLNEA
jgi:SNF2 family DNA or RNA helicase